MLRYCEQQQKQKQQQQQQQQPQRRRQQQQQKQQLDNLLIWKIIVNDLQVGKCKNLVPCVRF